MTGRLLSVLLLSAGISAAGNPVALTRPDGKNNWNLGRNGQAKIAGEHLIMDDGSPEQGAYAGTFAQPVVSGHCYRFQARLEAASTTNRSMVGGLYLHFYDSDGKELPGRRQLSIPYNTHGEKTVSLVARAPEEATTLRISVRTFAAPCSRITLRAPALEEIAEAEFENQKNLLPDFGQDFPPPAATEIAALAKQLPDHPFEPLPPPSDRTFWERVARRIERRGEILQLAEEAMAEPVQGITREFYQSSYNDPDGPYRYRKVYHRRSEQLTVLALAECLENQGRFLPKIQELTASILEEPTWVMPHHDREGVNISGQRITIDLGSSARGALLATIRRTFAESMPAELRQKIAERIQERLLIPFRLCISSGRIAGGFNWMLALNNWGAVCSSNLAYTALALELPKTEMAQLLLGVQYCMSQYLQSIPADGYCSEGIGYWNYGFGHYMMYAAALYEWSDGVIDEFHRPEAVRMARFVDRFEMHGRRFPAFSDTSMTNGVKPFNELAAARFYGCTSHRNPFWINDFLPQCALALRLLIDPETPPPGSGKLPLRDFFETSQILICRTGDATPLSFAAKGGHNAEQHNHNDVGSYAIQFGSLAAVCDPGGEEYHAGTFTAKRYQSDLINSLGHPVPKPDNTLQSPGAAYAAELLERSFTPESDRLRLNLRRAYEVPNLELLERNFEFRRTGTPGVVVTDRFRFSAPRPFEIAVITVASFRIVDDQTIEFFNDDHRLRLHIHSEPVSVHITAAPLRARPMTVGITPVRIALTLAEPAAAGTIRLEYPPLP